MSGRGRPPWRPALPDPRCSMPSRRLFALLALALLAPAVRADGPKSYPAAKHGKGELRYVDKVPVLILKGTPAEMGEQLGVLGIRNAPDLAGLHNQFLKDS